MTRKGFSLIETLLTLMIVASCTVLVIGNINPINNDHLFFINEYIDTHVDSIANRNPSYLDEYDIHFNESGHINGAKTINIGNHSIIVHLGNGYLTYE